VFCRSFRAESVLIGVFKHELWRQVNQRIVGTVGLTFSKLLYTNERSFIITSGAERSVRR
jgi:hypothetical protein